MCLLLLLFFQLFLFDQIEEIVFDEIALVLNDRVSLSQAIL